MKTEAELREWAKTWIDTLGDEEPVDYRRGLVVGHAMALATALEDVDLKLRLLGRLTKCDAMGVFR